MLKTFAGQNSVSIWLKGKNWKSERCSKEKCVAFGRLCIPQIPPNRPKPGSRQCLYFTSFFASCTSPLFPPKSPRFYIIFCDTFRGCPTGVGGYTYQRANWHAGQRQYRPSQHKLLPSGWDKMPDYARPCHNRLYSDTPHHTIRAQPENLGSEGTRARA